MDDGVLGTVNEIDVLLAREDERGVERHQNLVAVIVDAVVHGNQVAIAAALHARANRAKGLDGLVYVLDGARLAIAADKALQILLANVVAALVVAAVLINADVKVAVVMRVVPKDAHRMVQLVQDDGNLQGMETRQALVALRALLLVGIGVLQLRAGSCIRVALAKVVRVDAAVRQRQKLELERIAKGRVLGVFVLQVKQRRILQQIVVRDSLLGTERHDVHCTLIGKNGTCQFLLNIRRIRAKIFIY